MTIISAFLCRSPGFLFNGITGASCLSSTRSSSSHFLDGVKMMDSAGQKVDVEKVKNKTVALYFSAGWCPSCRMFTPKLKNFYNAVKADGFEVLWVSRDKTEEDQLEYYKKALPDCLYLPHASPYIREFLEKYKVKTIPALRLVDSNGKVLVEDAREKIQGEGVDDPKKLFKSWKEMDKK